MTAGIIGMYLIIRIAHRIKSAMPPSGPCRSKWEKNNDLRSLNNFIDPFCRTDPMTGIYYIFCIV
jgi:hypothetical protein